MTSTNSLGYEMEVSANDGDLPRLQAQLSQWESQHMNSSISLEEHLGFKPCQAEIGEVHQALDLPFPPGPDREPEKIDPIYFMLNRLMIQAAKKDQVNVIRYLLEVRRWPVSRFAVRRAMATYSFAVLELFQEFGWDINEPVSAYQCSILRKVVNSEPRVRWCLTHGADPNSQSIGKNIDVLSHAGEYASIPVLELLAAHGGDFRRSNALHCAAHGGVGYSTEEERIKVLAWLLEKTGIDINQRKHEFSGMESWREETMETALHCAVRSNALGCVRFLLEKGIDAGLRDFHGKTARDLAVETGNHEATKILDGQYSHRALSGSG